MTSESTSYISLWYCAGGWWPGTTERVLFHPAKVPTTRYRYRGAAIPAAWPVTG